MDRKRMLAWMLILLFLGVPMLALITSETDGDLGDQGGGSTWANLSTAGFQEGSIFTNSTIATGYQHACAVVENGSIFCWGDNSYGQLGIGSTDNQDYPVMTSLPEGQAPSASPPLTKRRAAYSPTAHCIAGAGTVTDRWPMGLSSELGTVEEPVHVPLPGGRTAVSVSTGQQYACAILDNASLYCWGNAAYGRLGTASQSNDLGGQSWTDDPTYVDLGGVGVIAVSAGGQGAPLCAILQNQSLYCWGDNSHGQVGGRDIH